MAIAEAPQPGVSTDVWKSSNNKSHNSSGPFSWRKRLGVIRSSDGSITLNDGREFEIDGSGKINGISVRVLKKETLLK